MPKAAPKTADARAAEARLIRAQLGDLGFPDDALGPVDAALAAFVREGVGFTGAHRVRELGVAVHLLLSTQARVVSHARVRRLS